MLVKYKIEIQSILTMSACTKVIPWNKIESVKNNLEPNASYKILLLALAGCSMVRATA